MHANQRRAPHVFILWPGPPPMVWPISNHEGIEVYTLTVAGWACVPVVDGGGVADRLSMTPTKIVKSEATTYHGALLGSATARGKARVRMIGSRSCSPCV